ncbi:D-alanine--D-alanine ligase [Candidatus Berkiella aquae]|uniref:D-alanine--D-alanine ligase n=1 Tax=Candidatus Berkiella aquae TaxID=295108 RepID=A0A0Q9YLR5_9GAMM|nr:D-alanine--D-alanine ligase family protein [Candidatus Berkiella aquae]MCS5710598.1 D-alanine--D-alanine ligase [Candidatus Berkiella aquae]
MKNILVICGGKSAEHEVSLLSARNIVSAMDRTAFLPIPIVISRSGSWHVLNEAAFFDEHSDFDQVILSGEICTLMRLPEQTILLTLSGKQIAVDAAFPLVHGPMGEDGTLQGLLEMMDIPYVGSGVLSSAIGMDKDMLKQVLAKHDIPVGPLVTISNPEAIPSFADVSKQLDSQVLFIKPAVMGSSVGISKVSTKEQYEAAVEQAFLYSFKVLVEKYLPGREVECSVLGNQDPIASCVGEIVPHHEFYSYEAKYLDPNGAELIIPAKLPEQIAQEVRQLAIRTFKAIECKGFARVDFFVSDHNKVYVNEINTIPGFTAISMYPKMWEASGLAYRQLISKLIELAYEEYASKQTIHLCPDVALPEKSNEPLVQTAS